MTLYTTFITKKFTTRSWYYIQLKAFVVDTKIKLDTPELDIPSLWPALEPNVRKEAEHNLLSGGIDIVVGMDQSYQKVSNTTIIKHPNLSLILLNTIWGYSLGGAVEDKNGAGHKTLLLANYTTREFTEPTFTEMEAMIKKYGTIISK